MSRQHEIVDSVSACRAAVALLEQEDFVAVDSEGVHLSKTGPLTLLQVATAMGHVYLFDVMREPRMFQDGGLKRLLEGQSVVKVLHSARNDGEALFAQFGVKLHNVHDTQLAEMELASAARPQMSKRQKLVDVCELYCPEKAAMLREQKDEVQTKWNKTEGEYWAKRPLTQEMIEYSADDVIAIVPEVYLAQTRLLAEKGLTSSFRARVENDIKSRYDGNEELRERLQEENRELVKSTLLEFAATARPRTKYTDITDESVLAALDSVLLECLEASNRDFPPLIRELLMQKIKIQLDELEAEMRVKGKDYEPNGGLRGRVHDYGKYLPLGQLKRQAQELEKAINKIIVQDIPIKYTMNTPLKHVATYERYALGSLRAKGERDPSINSVVLRFYWADKVDQLEGDIRKFRAAPRAFSVPTGKHKYLTFLSKGDVPTALKYKAKQFLIELQEAGKVAPPRPRRMRGGYYDDTSYYDDGYY